MLQQLQAGGFGEKNGYEYGTENGKEVHVQAWKTKACSRSAPAHLEDKGRPNDGQYEISYKVCVSQIKCRNWNMYKKNKKNRIWSKYHWHQDRGPCYIQWPLEQVLSEEQIEVNNWKNTGTTSNDSLQNLTMESCSEKTYLGNADKQRTRWAKQYLWIYSRLVYEYLFWLEVIGAKWAFWCI